MISNLSEKLLIIGAGAHVPYLMPTSQIITKIFKEMYKLRTFGGISYSPPTVEGFIKEKICKLAMQLALVRRPEHGPSNAFEIEAGSKFQEFLTEFCESGIYSIDAFLSNLKGETDSEKKMLFSDLGKLSIAVIISYFERQVPFGYQPDDWIELIINKYIKNDLEKFIKFCPSIITFNYDRFLERRLLMHLMRYHRKNEKEALAIIEQLPIVHVYGEIGNCDKWTPTDEKDFYGEAIKRIRVIGEDRSSDEMNEIKSKIRTYIEESTQIYFLGYGFDQLNNSVLVSGQVSDWREYKYIISTSVGLKKADLEKIYKSFGSVIRMKDGSIIEVDCMNLISEVAPLDKKHTRRTATIIPR